MKVERRFVQHKKKLASISAIDGYVSEWPNFETDREESTRRAVKNKGLLVADHKADSQSLSIMR